MGIGRTKVILRLGARAAFAAQAPVFSNSPTATATAGVAYSWTPTVLRGAAPLSFALVQGSFAGQLSLNPATGAISGTPASAQTLSNLVVEVTDALGRKGQIGVFQIDIAASPVALLPATQNVPFNNGTPRGCGGHALGYTGGGALSITSQKDASNADVTHFAITANKLVLAGTAYTTGPNLNNGPYTVVVTDGTYSSTVTVPTDEYGAHVNSSNEWTLALRNDATYGFAIKFGDKIRVRGGSYTGFYSSKTAQYTQRGGGPTAPTKERKADDLGWVVTLPDAGANVISIGEHTFAKDGSIANHYVCVKGFDLRRYNTALSGGDTKGIIQFRGGSSFVKYVGNEVSSRIENGYSVGSTASTLTGVYPNAEGSNLYFRDNYFHDMYNAFAGAWFYLYIIGNTFRRVWNDVHTGRCRNGFKFNWNKFYDLTNLPGIHGDCVQFQWNRYPASTQTLNAEVCCNMEYRGDAGDIISPDKQGVAFFEDASPPQSAGVVYQDGIKVYGNHMNISRGNTIYVENPKNVKIKWNNCLQGPFLDIAGGAGTIQQIVLTGDAATHVATNEVAYNYSRSVTSSGAAAHDNTAVTTADYPTHFVNPVIDTQSDPAVVLARFATKPGGPGDAAVHASGYWQGAITPYVNWAARTATFPDGFTLNDLADD